MSFTVDSFDESINSKFYGYSFYQLSLVNEELGLPFDVLHMKFRGITGQQCLVVKMLRVIKIRNMKLNRANCILYINDVDDLVRLRCKEIMIQ